MTDVVPLDQLNISLEPHLIDTLRPVVPIASADLASTLTPYLSSDPPSTIPYAVLRHLSQWARTTGCDTLRKQSPPLDPQAYTMVALLAGTTTSPERKFGDFAPARDPADVQAEKNKERKTITAILNALLSILGSGFAAWWAADKTGWQNEWVCKTVFLILYPLSSFHAESPLWTFSSNLGCYRRSWPLLHLARVALSLKEC